MVAVPDGNYMHGHYLAANVAQNKGMYFYFLLQFICTRILCSKNSNFVWDGYQMLTVALFNQILDIGKWYHQSLGHKCYDMHSWDINHAKQWWANSL